MAILSTLQHPASVAAARAAPYYRERHNVCFQLHLYIACIVGLTAASIPCRVLHCAKQLIDGGIKLRRSKVWMIRHLKVTCDTPKIKAYLRQLMQCARLAHVRINFTINPQAIYIRYYRLRFSNSIREHGQSHWGTVTQQFFFKAAQLWSMKANFWQMNRNTIAWKTWSVQTQGHLWEDGEVSLLIGHTTWDPQVSVLR